MAYTFFDSDGSILTARSSVVSGSAHDPYVQISSFLTSVPTTSSGNQSVSGTVGSSIIGQLPAGTAVLGSVATLQGTNPWITTFSNSSILATQQGTVVASLVSTLPSSVLVGSSIFGQLPAGTAVLGSVAVLQGTNPWNISGSVVSQQLGARITSVISTTPSSLLVGASVFGQLPAGTAVLGSVATLQGTSPWNIAGSVLAVQGTWSGSILATISGTPNVNTAGSVLSQQLGTRTTSVVGSIPSSLLTGVYAHRNDAIASFLGGNLTWNPVATDSAGRIIIKPFTSDDGTLIEYQGSVVSTSVTLIRASAIGLRNYVTDFFMANTGATTTLVTFQDGSTSILGRTIAPTASGSNAPHLAVPMKSARSQDLAFAAGSNTSVLYVTVRGYQAP